MKSRTSSSKSKGRTPPKRNRPAINITLPQEILDLMAAYQDFKESTGDQKPDKTWMIEQGLKLFFKSMKEKSADCKAFLEKREAEFQVRKQATVVSIKKIPDVKSEDGAVGGK